MPKVCTMCRASYTGFGAVCASCRKSPAAGAGSGPKAVDPSATLCHACGKRVYAMEQRNIEGLVFHKDCFRCRTCDRKLESNYAKSELGFFCLTHFHQIAKVTGGYKTGTGPTKNAATADLVDSLVRRGSSSAASSPTNAPTGPSDKASEAVATRPAAASLPEEARTEARATAAPEVETAHLAAASMSAAAGEEATGQAAPAEESAVQVTAASLPASTAEAAAVSEDRGTPAAEPLAVAPVAVEEVAAAPPALTEETPPATAAGVAPEVVPSTKAAEEAEVEAKQPAAGADTAAPQEVPA